jgi:hypothetical protein
MQLSDLFNKVYSRVNMDRYQRQFAELGVKDTEIKKFSYHSENSTADNDQAIFRIIQRFNGRLHVRPKEPAISCPNFIPMTISLQR